MSKKTLLLNSTYEVLHFIDEVKAIIHLLKDKVDVISEWDDEFILNNGRIIKIPAVLRMKYNVKRRFTNLNWSRKGVLKRDNYKCQYCGISLKPANATLDHIIPKSYGGKNSYTNCVTSCFPCNNKKSNRTPDEAGMVLLSKPTIPLNYIYSISDNEKWHPDWSIYTDLKK